MIKYGRNESCPCGSGRKYKRCCWQIRDEADREIKRLRSEPVPMAQVEAEVAELDRMSNLVGDLTARGRIPEAEDVCRELRRQYPGQIDWIQRSAAIYAAKGERKLAAEWYRKAACFARTKPGFPADSIGWYDEQADALDPL